MTGYLMFQIAWWFLVGLAVAYFIAEWLDEDD